MKPHTAGEERTENIQCWAEAGCSYCTVAGTVVEVGNGLVVGVGVQVADKELGCIAGAAGAEVLLELLGCHHLQL